MRTSGGACLSSYEKCTFPDRVHIPHPHPLGYSFRPPRCSRRWEEEDTRDAANLDVQRVMGQGAFGIVWLVKHRRFSERFYALKCLDKRQVMKQNWRSVVMREKEVLASLPIHPCVIALYQTFQDENNLFMLMELAVGGELYKLLSQEERFEPQAARFYCGCCVLALGHLHTHNVVFRDLKVQTGSKSCIMSGL